MSETRKVDAWEGFVTSGVAETTQGSFAHQPTDRSRDPRRPTRARAALHQLVTRATIAISSELYLRHVTRASPLFVRASGH